MVTIPDVNNKQWIDRLKAPNCMQYQSINQTLQHKRNGDDDSYHSRCTQYVYDASNTCTVLNDLDNSYGTFVQETQ